ncbi:hypothetical protein LCGC14_3047040 [marine sediment metagenome]|uniref:Uncharacterized protein n=1 Tax=marine sediment metagenome TaxID=412755 RepID=A0A0F8ZDR2_9ZZZZ
MMVEALCPNCRHPRQMGGLLGGSLSAEFVTCTQCELPFVLEIRVRPQIQFWPEDAIERLRQNGSA